MSVNVKLHHTDLKSEADLFNKSLFLYSWFVLFWLLYNFEKWKIECLKSKSHLHTGDGASRRKLNNVWIVVLEQKQLYLKLKTRKHRPIVFHKSILPIHCSESTLCCLWVLSSPHLSLSVSVPSWNHIYLRERRCSHHIHLGPQRAAEHPSRPFSRGLQQSAEGCHLGASGEHPWARRLSTAAHSKDGKQIWGFKHTHEH